jgi:3-methyladenine DNA glycosylase AlkD
MSPGELVRKARAAPRTAADESVRKQQRSYFKPWERVQIYGVNTPDVRRIEPELYGLVRKSWNYPEAVEFCDTLMHDRFIEMKSLGLTLLARYQREFDSELLDRIAQWLACDLCDNWAVTDQLATQIITRVLENDERLAANVEKWNGSPNVWLRRASAVSFVRYAIEGFPQAKRRSILERTRPERWMA